MPLLDDILAAKRLEVEAAKRRLPLEELKRRIRTRATPERFGQALKASGKPMALIAELKRKSPSAGWLRERFDPVSLAQQLEEAGASALSVLTDEPFFGGSLEALRSVQAFVEIPLLRKDFIIDPYQLYESASSHADAVLLIGRVLSPSLLRECLQVTEALGLDALVEVHDESDLDTALKAGARIIGINHRDLQTFQLDPTVSARLLPSIPKYKLIVAEIGIQTSADLKRLADLGVHAALIWEALMRAPDVVAKVRELFRGIW